MYYHSILSTMVKKRTSHTVTAETVLISTGYEATGTAIADAGSFSIQDGLWHVYRSPGSAYNSSNQAAELIGVEASLSSGPALRAVEAVHGSLPRQLMAECIQGIIQSETYLYRYRGFATMKEYEHYWNTQNAGICWLYSNMGRKTVAWSEHTKDRHPGDCLFNRSKNVIVCGTEGEYGVEGVFIDSFHELRVSFTTARGIITKASGSFQRSPDPVCREAADLVSRLENTDLAALSRQRIGQLVGGSQGCAHLADLLQFMRQTLIEICAAAEGQNG